MDFRILGPLQVLDDDGRELTVAGAKQRGLLAILLLHANEVVSSDRLIDALWGEEPPATAAKALQVHVSRLRRALDDGAAGSSSVLSTEPAGYLLRVPPGHLDLDRFEEAVATATRALADGAPGEAATRLDEALAMWRGEPLADLAYEPFAEAAVARLEALRLAAIEQRLDAQLALGRHDEAVPQLEALVREHPFREQLRAKLMLALYRAGRQADALAAYRDARQVLVDELGIEPSAELRELEAAILAQDTQLAAPAPPRGQDRAPAPRAPVERRVRRRGWLAAAAVCALLASASLAVVLATRSEGPKGAPLADDSQAVVAIDPGENRVTAAASVGARPGALAYEPRSRSLWVANRDDETITHVDAKTLKVGRTIPARGEPVGLAAGGGQVWLGTTRPNESFVTARRVDPRFDTVDAGVRVPTVANGTVSLGLGAKSLWVAPSTGLLAEVDRLSAKRRASLDPLTSPTAVSVGHGAVWLIDADANSVTRIDRSTGDIESVPVGNAPSAIAIGPSGVWVTLRADDVLLRLNPDSAAITKTIRVGRAPTGVAVGLGSVWVANSGDGTVSRIDLAGGKARAIRVGASPQAVAVAGSRVWVSVTPRVLGPPPSGGTLRVAMDPFGPPDPPVSYDVTSASILYATCAELLNYPDAPAPAGSRLEPEVAAARPVVSADGKTYTFRIRPGYRFSPPSNEPVTAATFKASMERAMSPALNSQVQTFVTDVVGAGPYMAGKAAHVSGISASGSTLRIRLTRPAADLVARLSLPPFCAVPPDTPIDPKGVRTVPSAGPYYVASYTPDQGALLRRNPNYHGPRPHRAARIEILFGQKNALRDVLNGHIDYTNQHVTAANAAKLRARLGAGSPPARRGRQQFFSTPRLAVDHLTLNTARPLFASARMRRAVSYAIDRSALARLGGLVNDVPAKPISSYLPPGMPGYLPREPFALRADLERARRLVGGRRTRAVLWTLDSGAAPRMAAAVKKQLARIGIDVAIRVYNDTAFFGRLYRPGAQFDIAIEAWIADNPDPSNFLMLLDGRTIHSTQNFNSSYLDDPATNRTLARLSRLTGPERYIRYGRAAFDIARRLAPWAAFAAETQYNVVSARTGCVVQHPIYGFDLAALCIRG
ncbi:MAG: ABC transporter substrate-binding protein [Thermoleophilaceae bacterium]